MAGVHFSFDNFRELISLNIGISERLDESRSESFALLYCDFSAIPTQVVNDSLTQILRTSDAIVNHESDFFFVLPYTDKYGAQRVKDMFDEFFAKQLSWYVLAYPLDGETPEDILSNLQDSVSVVLKKELHCLDRFSVAFGN